MVQRVPAVPEVAKWVAIAKELPPQTAWAARCPVLRDPKHQFLLHAGFENGNSASVHYCPEGRTEGTSAWIADLAGLPTNGETPP